jgi:hypothetical protein
MDDTTILSGELPTLDPNSNVTRQPYQLPMLHPDEADLDLKVGDTDSSGNEILAVYSKRKGLNAVYEISGHRVITKGEGSLADHPDLNASMTAIANLTVNTPDLRLKHNSSLAHAMRLWMDGDARTAHAVLRQVYDEMVLYLTRRGKAAYLGGAVLTMLIALLAFLSTRFLRISSLDTIHIFWAVVCSSIGGFLSVSLGSQSQKIDLHDSPELNFFSGITRIVIAMICGVILYFLIQAEFVFSFIKHGQESYGYIIVFFLSGFSEKLVPNLLTRLDQSAPANLKAEMRIEESAHPHLNETDHTKPN